MSDNGDSITPTWLRKQGDRCAARASRYVANGEGATVLWAHSETYARLSRDWFAAAAQAYAAAAALEPPDSTL